MDQSTWASLLSLDPPLLHLLRGSRTDADALIWSGCGGQFEQCHGVRTVRGHKLVDVPSLFDEFAGVFQFPSYFGRNWDALDECISDLEWIPAPWYVLFVTDAHLVLPEKENDFRIFVTLLSHVAATWVQPVPPNSDWRWTHDAIPFHVVFQTPAKEEVAVTRRLHDAGVVASPLPVP